MKTYEIQRHEKGKWIHDSYFESADLAVAQAKQMAGSARYDGVRVVEDEFIEGKDITNARFLFISKPDGQPAPRRKQTTQARRTPPQEVPRKRTEPRPSKPAKGPSSLVRIVMTLAIIVVLGLGAHYALQAYFQ